MKGETFSELGSERRETMNRSTDERTNERAGRTKTDVEEEMFA